MICAIHQPQTFPWLGYFAKILQSDIFVLLDNVQFKKNEWQNRNRIKTVNGWQWLTVPVIHNFGQTIKDVQINTSINWQKKHLQALKTNYTKAPYYSEVMPGIEKLYKNDWMNLAGFNIAGIRWIIEKLGMTTPIIEVSDIKELHNHPEISPDERLILITKSVQADSYLSGAGGHNYLDKALFPKNDLKLLFQEYGHPVYRQVYGEFISHLSVLDLLFNEGPNSLEIIKGGIR